MSCEDEARDEDDAAEAKELQRFPANQKLGERPETDSLSQPLRRNQTHQYLDLRFLLHQCVVFKCLSVVFKCVALGIAYLPDKYIGIE